MSPASLQEALSEFQRRGLVDMDEASGEIFVLAWFRFNKFPPGPRRRVLLDEVRKIDSQRLKKLVEKSIENSIGCIYANEESTTYAPREGKLSEGKESSPTPLPRGLPCLPLAIGRGRGQKLKI